ncbi:hypothetical protein [Legionella bononiensis]|uniref:Uncharacterized protein n=1 Tax=Legionella bononiensis TaxID=2793102 RepID=A0ABS1WF71_9GAMM|nr:hypothetical protein [Legionella bononiensis]MBL7479275.1 hypothetical protein [Legionella bononiensis]MBL7527997.1 hypothetical protein [Legionella bononiensis]MBL7563926.1 hypothetical protein [Legionella bononiensis]
MACIFTNKPLLEKEYKRLFLEKLSTLTKLKECLSARYDKKEITDAELKGVLSNNHKKIYDFIGRSNENRLRYFFGHSAQSDLRDAQIRLIDRLILDSIHFEVINMLMLQFDNEYSNNLTEIEKEWHNELHDHAQLGPLPNKLIIQNAIKSIKNSVFKDLVFPENKSVALFHVNGQSIIPNKHVFINWLSQSNTKSPIKAEHSIYAVVAAALIALFAFAFFIVSWGLPGATAAGLGGAVAASLNPAGFAIGLFVAFLLSGLISYACSNPLKGSIDTIDSSLSSPGHCPNRSSTEFIIGKLPKREQTDALNNQPPTDEFNALFTHTKTLLEDAMNNEGLNTQLNPNL